MSKWKFLWLAIALLLSLQSAQSQCRPVTDDRPSYPGRMIMAHSKLQSFRSLRGVVRTYAAETAERGVEGVLVEVLDHPEQVSGDPRTRVGHRRIAACITGRDGGFALKVPEGEYELRFSKEGGWDWTCYRVAVQRRSSRTGLEVILQAST